MSYDILYQFGCLVCSFLFSCARYIQNNVLGLMLSNSILYMNIYLLYGAHFTHTVTHQCNIFSFETSHSTINMVEEACTKKKKTKKLRAKGRIWCILKWIMHVKCNGSFTHALLVNCSSFQIYNILVDFFRHLTLILFYLETSCMHHTF